MSKLHLLRYLATVPDATAEGVAAALGMSLPAAGVALLRLARAGLVSRTFDPHQSRLFYALTQKGQARVDFFDRGPR